MPAAFPAIVTATVGILATASAGLAVDLSLSVDGTPAEYLEDDYICADGRAFTVTYVNADPVFSPWCRRPMTGSWSSCGRFPDRAAATSPTALSGGSRVAKPR